MLTRRYRIEWMLLGLLLLLLGAVIGYGLFDQKADIDASERDRLQVQARVIEDNLGRQLEVMNNALVGIRENLSRWNARTMGTAASRELSVLNDAMPGVRAIGIFDAEGTTLASSRKELIGSTIARERDFFKVPRARPDADVLYVSPPFKSVLGVFSINVVRAVIGQRGEFAGIVAATLEPEYFDVVLRSVLYAPDMRTVLAHGDGKAFLFMPANERSLGMDLNTPGSTFSRHRASGQPASLLTGPVSAEERMVAARTVTRASLRMDKPLVTFVSRDLRAVYAPWRQDAFKYGGLYGLMAVTAILSLYFAQKRQRAFDAVAAAHEEQQRESAERLKATLDAIPDLMFEVGLDGRFHDYRTPQGVALFVPPEDFLGKRISDVLPPDAAAVGMSALQEAFASGRSTGMEYELEFPHGRSWFELSVSRKAGTIEHEPRFIVLSRDITDRKRAEAARADLESQLRESQKMEALGTLAGGIAHDFNNIVATILGNVELARQDLEPSHTALVSLEEIGKAGRRAKALVQQILAFGRRYAVTRKVISLAPVVEEVEQLVRATLPAGASLRVSCAAHVPPVLADARLVEQVLLNLCSNAEYAVQGLERPGVLEIRLDAHVHAPGGSRESPLTSAHQDLLPGRYACLTVRDNGRGMNKETVARIFEPFFTTKPVGEGTGLGLAVAHSIVREHKASIEARSEAGVGTEFRIYFPVADAPVAAAAEQRQDPHARDTVKNAATVLEGHGKHILYVDDDEAIVFLMTRLLERRGYRVSGYTDAGKALAMVREAPAGFDLAVTDYAMPGMSGLHVASALREIRADLPVAIATGYITEDLRAKAPAAGVSELIYKPNSVGDLCDAVARLADRVQPASRPVEIENGPRFRV